MWSGSWEGLLRLSKWSCLLYLGWGELMGFGGWIGRKRLMMLGVWRMIRVIGRSLGHFIVIFLKRFHWCESFNYFSFLLLPPSLFPLVLRLEADAYLDRHQTLKKTVVRKSALVYHWQGAITALKPVLLAAHQGTPHLIPHLFELEWINERLTG